MLNKLLLPFTLVSNLATLVGLWIAYVSAPTPMQTRIGHVLILLGAISSILAYLAFALFVMRPARHLVTALDTPNDGAVSAQDKAQPSVVQENKQTISQEFNPTINIGGPDPRATLIEQEKLRNEELVLNFMKQGRKKGLVSEIAPAVNLTRLETSEALERLYCKKLLFRSPIDQPGDFVYWLSDLVE